MLGLLATDVRYIWQEIGLEMTTSTAMMTKLQLSESTLALKPLLQPLLQLFIFKSDVFVSFTIYALQKQKAHLRLPELHCSYKNAVCDHP